MHIGFIYFWTATIFRWQKLLMPEENRDLIIRCLNELIDDGYIEVYAFVIMPNHVHFIWKMLKWNGAEKPHVSFLKHTAHELRKYLIAKDFLTQSNFMVDENDRGMRIWRRDSLAILLDYPFKAYQKLNYLHDNPLQGHWQLARRAADYEYSSASFYHREEKGLVRMKDLRKVFR